MPLPPPSNPLLDLMYKTDTTVGDTVSREELMQIQREQETRLLGTMLVQAVFLALAIMLYSTWTWSQFGKAYESALFYGLMGFSLQASLYYVYRTMFEDSASHRKQLKRMRNRQKQRMASMKFEVEKKQLEYLMDSQMAQFQTSHQMAMADGVINPQEQAILNQQQQAIAATAQQINPQYDLEELAKQLGVDRFRLGPLPVGPKLTLSQPPVTSVTLAQSQPQADKLNLSPPGTMEDQERALQEQLA